MAQAPIENPVINSPFVEPARHFVVVDGQVSGAIESRRRPSEFFVPVAKPKKASPQLALQFNVRQQPNEVVNEVRAAVARWRAQDVGHARPTGALARRRPRTPCRDIAASVTTPLAT